MNIFNQEEELRELTQNIIHESDGWEGVMPLRMVFTKESVELLISALQIAIKNVAEVNMEMIADEKMAAEKVKCEQCGEVFERAEMTTAKVVEGADEGDVRLMDVCYPCKANIELTALDE